MNLFTCCPQCQTTFRVTTQQLQASGGQVRCGFCSGVFDAFATLTAQEPRSEPAASLLNEPARAAANPAAQPPAAAAAIEAALPGRNDPASRPDPAASLYEWEFRMPAAPRRTGLWLSLSALLLALLAAQAAYAFRTELSIMFPQTRKFYSQACSALGCSFPPPKLSSFLHIEASDLKAVDAAVPNEIELIVAIRNRAPVELAYPAFELTLTNAQDQTIARRVFLPREYLSAVTTDSALKAGAELPLHLFLDTGDLRAAGYRLYLFYP